MKKTALALALTASTATAQMSEDTHNSLEAVWTYLWQQCEASGNTRQQCHEILYKHWVEVGREASMRCMLPRQEFANRNECLNHEVLEWLRNRIEDILEEVTQPIWEAL